MKLIFWNVNGLRACHKKGGISAMIAAENPDIAYFFEIKALPDQLAPIAEEFADYETCVHSAEKPGYAGSAVFARRGLGARAAPLEMAAARGEGRLIETIIGGTVLLGGYFPNGGKSPQAFAEKLEFFDQLQAHALAHQQAGRRVAIFGDVNVAHHPIDLARPEANKKSIGFLPEERQKLTNLEQAGFTDAWRQRNPDVPTYSWWSMRSGARERNVGWRIDSLFACPALLPAIKDIRYSAPQDFPYSDHGLVVVEVG